MRGSDKAFYGSTLIIVGLAIALVAAAGVYEEKHVETHRAVSGEDYNGTVTIDEIKTVRVSHPALMAVLVVSFVSIIIGVIYLAPVVREYFTGE